MKKSVLLYIIIVGTMLTGLNAQTSVNMGAQTSITGCNINIYDDGGAQGNYGPSHDYTLTVYPESGQGRAVIEILSIDIHHNDTLFIYDGTSTSGAPLVALNNVNAFLYTTTVMATQGNATGALTVRFKTSFFLPMLTNHGAGFLLHASCATACQPFQIAFDTARCSHLPTLNPEDSYYYLDLCPNDTVALAVKGIYGSSSGSYPRSDTSTNFIWNLETGTSLNGIGMDGITHVFTAGNGHEVSILANDTLQCPVQQPITFRVRTSTSPFYHLGTMPALCEGQTYTPTVGYENGSDIQLAPINFEQHSSLIVQDTVFLPDGENCPPYGTYYRSNVTFTDFAPGATVSSANDILYVRIKMEHSAIEDLQIDIYCPNGNSCNILPHPNFDYGYYGSFFYYRVNLGRAVRPDGGTCSPALNLMGEPWDYVWSNNTTQGYQYASANGCFYDVANMSRYYNPHWDDGNYTFCVDSTNVATMTQVYHPNQNFSSLVGCPLNGNWYIQVQDHYNEDNGYIVEWELALSPDLLPVAWDYSIEVDSFYFIGNQVINGNTLQPLTAGNQAYTFTLLDDFGCEYDTSVSVTVFDSPDISLGEDRQICNGSSVTLMPENVNNSCQYLWNTGATTPQITVNEPGDYILTASILNSGSTLCQSSDTVSLTVQPTYHTVFEADTCEQYVWDGETYTETGDYTRTYTSTNGCDSVVTLHLSIGHPETEEQTVSACGKYIWCGETLTMSGDYERTIPSSHNCDSMMTLHLTILDTFLRPSESNPDFCTTQETTLSVEGNFDDYVWSTGEVGSYIFVTQGGTYSVTASNHACEQVAVFNVPHCPLVLLLPNAITPSKSDGLNDALSLPEYMQNQIGDFSIAIFNRWGELVFLSDDKNFRWDGTKDGKLMVNATYNYLIRCTDRNGKSHTFTGSVTVL